MGSHESHILEEELSDLTHVSGRNSSTLNAENPNQENMLLSPPAPVIPSFALRPRPNRLRLLVPGAGSPSGPPSSPKAPSYRAPSEKKISMKKAVSVRGLLTGLASPRREVPPLRAPSKGVYNAPVCLVHERSSFVRAHPTQASCSHSFTVYVHIYEITNGMLLKHGPKLIGIQTPGVYHSAIVCYGMEFYFEGGIAIAGAGKTRVGTKYKAVRLGSTSVSFLDFIRWVRARERDTYQLHDYKIKQHNCHYFTRKAAEFLLGKQDLVPQYLFSTTDEFFQTERGAAVYEVMSVVIQGSQYFTAQQQIRRLLGLKSSLNVLLHCLVDCGITRQPPKAVVIFQVDDEAVCRETLDGVQPYAEQLVEAKLVNPLAISMLSCFTIELSRGYDSVDLSSVYVFVDVVTEALIRNPPVLWGPLLNALRVSILHHMVLTTVVFHSKLLSVLVFASQEFPRLLPDGKLNLLRVICNLACGSHGAILLSEPHFLNIWVSLVGMGLMESHSAIVYTASCLAVNIAISEVTWVIPSMKNDMSRYSCRSKIVSLASVALYNISRRSVEELPEPSFNMLLTCLLWFMASNTSVQKYIVWHPFYPLYSALYRRAQTAESRSLIAIMERLEVK